MHELTERNGYQGAKPEIRRNGNDDNECDVHCTVLSVTTLDSTRVRRYSGKPYELQYLKSAEAAEELVRPRSRGVGARFRLASRAA